MPSSCEATNLLIFNQLHTQEGVWSALWRNLRDHSLAFGFRGNQNWNPGFVGLSILNPYEALFFGLGAAAAIWRWRRNAALRLLLLWTGALTLPVLLAKGTGTEPFVNHILRMNGAVPAVFLLTAVGAWETVNFLKNRLYAEKSAAFAVTAAFLATGLILVQGIISLSHLLPPMGTIALLEWTIRYRVERSGTSAEHAAVELRRSHSCPKFLFAMAVQPAIPVSRPDPDSPDRP